VRRKGLEPLQELPHQNLNLARLPIPPPSRGTYRVFAALGLVKHSFCHGRGRLRDGLIERRIWFRVPRQRLNLRVRERCGSRWGCAGWVHATLATVATYSYEFAVQFVASRRTAVRHGTIEARVASRYVDDDILRPSR
jgi:hypothetical protein